MGEWPEDLDIPDQVFVADNLEASEIEARDEFNRQNPPLTGMIVPEDLRTIELVKRPWRNNKGLWFELSGNRVLSAHLAELAPGGNSVRHRHTTEAYIYIVSGYGYSIVNYEGQPEERIDWSEGMLFSPPAWAWHQHFNADPERPARYLAIQDTGLVRHMRLHQIERHPSQLKIGEGTDYVVDAVPAQADEPAETAVDG
ncbi:MAG TPA: cupin domain-containing protein [Gaiellaceae bacterium]|jgi:quercetin dioxygenase-like cupin family protein|nr:cupin domain-containing protein [Gaiellaceae bacterium]